MDEQGTLTLNIVLDVEKELKTFLLQLRGNVVEQITSADFDFNSLSYYDISSQLKNKASINKSASIMYIVDDCRLIPEAIYQFFQID